MCIIDTVMFCFASLNDVTVSVVFCSIGSRGNRAFVHRLVPLGHVSLSIVCTTRATSGERSMLVLFDVDMYFNV